jgi:FKBP-type peptidyl-prolyl cis-trans isomerase SlyD
MSAKMSNQEPPGQVIDNLVVSMSYSLSIGGETIDSTDEGETLQFIQGYGSIIPGLERAIQGMGLGETRAIRVPAGEAYGAYDPQQINYLPLSEFPDELDLQPGLELEMTDQEGDTVYARILSVGKSRVKMDFNHPLAGKALDFEVTIQDLRLATPQELEQGFVD